MGQGIDSRMHLIRQKAKRGKEEKGNQRKKKKEI